MLVEQAQWLHHNIITQEIDCFVALRDYRDDTFLFYSIVAITYLFHRAVQKCSAARRARPGSWGVHLRTL